MNSLQRDVIQRIGNAPILALRNIGPDNGARLLLKLESLNPSGSMKYLSSALYLEQKN
jgi:cysteine synthase A